MTTDFTTWICEVWLPNLYHMILRGVTGGANCDMVTTGGMCAIGMQGGLGVPKIRKSVPVGGCDGYLPKECVGCG
jgi:hypothetical protein